MVHWPKLTVAGRPRRNRSEGQHKAGKRRREKRWHKKRNIREEEGALAEKKAKPVRGVEQKRDAT